MVIPLNQCWSHFMGMKITQIVHGGIMKVTFLNQRTTRKISQSICAVQNNVMARNLCDTRAKLTAWFYGTLLLWLFAYELAVLIIRKCSCKNSLDDYIDSLTLFLQSSCCSEENLVLSSRRDLFQTYKNNLISFWPVKDTSSNISSHCKHSQSPTWSLI